MPITVGSQSDVPATGDPIVSPWPQDTATKLVHRFATVAARNAWSTRPEGAVAYTLDTDTLAIWTGAAWVDIVDADGAVITGNVRIGKSGPNFDVQGLELYNAGVIWSGVDALAEPNIALKKISPALAAAEHFIDFWGRTSGGTNNMIGSVTVVGTSGVAYNTTSDPRLKSAGESRGIDDAAERARQLGANAWRGQYLDAETGEPSGDVYDFLSSHDVEDVAGYAVTGDRDAVDDDGNPVYQQVNYPALVPLLFAALADAFARIEALEQAAG